MAMKRVLPVLAVFLLIALLLAAWTLTSPPILETRSASELSNSVFSSARSTVTDNLTDGAGSYLLAFGLDFPDVAVPAGMRIQFRVYAALLSEHITSPFVRGITLRLDEVSLSIDGAEDKSVKVVTQPQAGLVTYELQSPNTGLTLGLHHLEVHLAFSTIDINYVGYTTGSSGIAFLKGNLTIGS